MAGHPWCRQLVVVGALVVLGSCIWCLRGLATPTVGFDARAVWLMRAGWFLQSHHQLLIKLRVPDVDPHPDAYPPLVSATTAVAWRVTGDQSMRLGVVVIALLNTCALATAAFALVESGRSFTRRLLLDHRDIGSSASGRGAPSGSRWLSFVPLVVGIIAASLLVFVAFGITEPFMTNGYADPIWSLAAVGAVAYGLQLGYQSSQPGGGADPCPGGGNVQERRVGHRRRAHRPDRRTGHGCPCRRRTAAAAGGDRCSSAATELAAVAAWPVLMRSHPCPG